ncbi:hypothetical protein INT45_002773 [Circinella minor]|uniref:Uncharacterized protein n=1 Tax=Circinella minor TaxID=1195481 RepID=A0A8H7RJM7_9FUNG|nr:hypothetical protein INT45_002773 [Circinella minor]
MPFHIALSAKHVKVLNKKITKRERNKNRPIASYTFLKDPMRNSNVPDILGQFIDPMGGRATYTQGIDPTNTGA